MVTALVVSMLLSGGFTRPGLEVRDEGTSRGWPIAINFVGGSISCAAPSSGVVTCTVTGGSGGFAPTEVEIDFGTAADFVATTVITDATVSTSSKIAAWQSGTAATGRQADENEMDEITCRGIPGTGNFTLICSCARSVTHGKFKVLYSVG